MTTYGELNVQFWMTWIGGKSCPYQDLNSDPSTLQLITITCYILTHYKIMGINTKRFVGMI